MGVRKRKRCFSASEVVVLFNRLPQNGTRVAQNGVVSGETAVYVQWYLPLDAKSCPFPCSTAEHASYERKSNGHSTGNVIKIISGKNELLIEGENGKIRVNRGGLTGQPVEQIDADPRAKKEIEELMVAIYGGPIPSGENPHMQDFWDCIASGKTPEANGLITRARRAAYDITL
jgi:hypothetical protein